MSHNFDRSILGTCRLISTTCFEMECYSEGSGLQGGVWERGIIFHVDLINSNLAYLSHLFNLLDPTEFNPLCGISP